MQANPTFQWNVFLNFKEKNLNVLYFSVMFCIFMVSSLNLLERKKNHLPFLSSVCCYFLIGLKRFHLFHFFTHAAGSCLLACFCSCKNQIEVFSTIKAQLWVDGNSTYVSSGNSRINGSRAIQFSALRKHDTFIFQPKSIKCHIHRTTKCQ